MTRKEKAISIIKNELACVKNVDCERAECRNCSLVMPEHDVIEALGEWISTEEVEGLGNCKCSNCDAYFYASDAIPKWNFCPWCGSRNSARTIKDGEQDGDK